MGRIQNEKPFFILYCRTWVPFFVRIGVFFMEFTCCLEVLSVQILSNVFLRVPRKRTPRVRYAVPLGSDVADPRGTVFMQNVWKWAQKSFKESVAAMVIAEGIQICGTRRGIRVPFLGIPQ